MTRVDAVSTKKFSPQQQHKIKIFEVLECRVLMHSNILYNKVFYESMCQVCNTLDTNVCVSDRLMTVLTEGL